MRKDARRHRLTADKPLSVPIEAEIFKGEVRFWAHRLELEPAEIHLVALGRKWASCSPRGRLTFDTTLLCQPEEFRREVIVHELLHLRVPNHGPLFSALLRTHVAARSKPSRHGLVAQPQSRV